MACMDIYYNLDMICIVYIKMIPPITLDMLLTAGAGGASSSKSGGEAAGAGAALGLGVALGVALGTGGGSPGSLWNGS